MDEIKTEVYDEQYVVRQNGDTINPNNTIATVRQEEEVSCKTFVSEALNSFLFISGC